jgi:hypothetical protein
MTEMTPNLGEMAAQTRPTPGSTDYPYDTSNGVFMPIMSFDVTTFPTKPGVLFVCIRSGGTTLQGSMDAEMMEKVADMLKQAATAGRSGLFVPPSGMVKP